MSPRRAKGASQVKRLPLLSICLTRFPENCRNVVSVDSVLGQSLRLTSTVVHTQTIALQHICQSGQAVTTAINLPDDIPENCRDVVSVDSVLGQSLRLTSTVVNKQTIALQHT